MAKKLIQILDDELFNLLKECWFPDKSLRSHSVTLYAKRISELYRDGYDVRIHCNFVSYFRNRLYKNHN